MSFCFCIHRGGGGGGGGGWRAVQDRDQFYRYDRKALTVWSTVKIILQEIFFLIFSESRLGYL